MKKGAAIGARSGQNGVHIGDIGTSLNQLAVFVQRGRLSQLIGAVQMIHFAGNKSPMGVEPRPPTKTIARTHYRRGVGPPSTEISEPGAATHTHGGGQRLTMRIGACQPAQIC